MPFAQELSLLFPLILLTGPRPWPVKISLMLLGFALVLIPYFGAPHPYPGVLMLGGLSYLYAYRLVWFPNPPIPKVEVYVVSLLFAVITIAMIVAINIMSPAH